MDKRLVALVVAAVTVTFVVVVVNAILRDERIDTQWFWLMGIVVGGAVGFNVVSKRRP